MVMFTADLPPLALSLSKYDRGINLSTSNFQAAAWFLWSSSKAALRILSKTFLDLGEASNLALYSLIASASPLGLPTLFLLPSFLESTKDFLGLPTLLLTSVTSSSS